MKFIAAFQANYGTEVSRLMLVTAEDEEGKTEKIVFIMPTSLISAMSKLFAEGLAGLQRQVQGTSEEPPSGSIKFN